MSLNTETVCTVAWMRSFVSNATTSIKKKQLTSKEIVKIRQAVPLEVKEYEAEESLLLKEVQEGPLKRNVTTIKGISVVLGV